MTIYAAEPGSAAAERMQLLASWAASQTDSTSPDLSPEPQTTGRWPARDSD